MSSQKNKNLLNSMARLRSLIPHDEHVPQCSEIDWTVPRHFEVEAFCQLTNYGNALSDTLAAALQGVFDQEFDVTLNGIDECFGGSVSEQVAQDQENFYFLPISLSDKKQAGVLSLPFETCTTLIRQVLCDPEAEIGQEGNLSLLEQSILQDNVFPITDILLQGIAECGGPILNKSEHLAHNQWPNCFAGLEEMCKLSYSATYESTQLEMSLYLLDEVIDSLLGTARPQPTQEQLQKIPAEVIERVKDIGVDISVGFETSMMTLNSILTLEEEDVVLLDHTVSMPTNVIINQQIGFKAWPAQSKGQWAVVVSEKVAKDND